MKLSRNVLTFFMILFFVYCTVPQDSARDLFPSKTTGHTGEWLSDGDTAIKIDRIWEYFVSSRSGYSIYYLDYEIGNPTSSSQWISGMEENYCYEGFCQTQYSYLMEPKQLAPGSTMSNMGQIELNGPPDYITIRFLNSIVNSTYVIYPLPLDREMPPEVKEYFEGR